ncbi:hypothetical protein RDI58_024547 [Solanum bulbocastanum]|uniref:Uncharacterized protein n=1 Tax=Solanum bulbocastanum TaxID=147425 RepID=A0AAN8T1G9_SOLBU
MVEVTIYFHHGGEWLTSPEPHYDRGYATYCKGYDPELISFIDLLNEYINKLDSVGVQELIVLASTGKYFKIIDDEGGLLEVVRTVLAEAHQRYCARHIEANWCKRWGKELVKLVGRPNFMREREKDEALKRQEVWKQTRKGKVMTCSNCGEQNHNASGCEKGKQPAKQGKESGRRKKRQLRSGLVDEDEASEEDINCTAPQPTQETQFEYVSSSSYFLVAEDMMMTLG